ncbi:hypothetical protein FKM82_027702 [Ascaphus truei]
MQRLLGCNSGSQVAFQVNKDSELDSINFQTSLMTKVMMQFPEVLLLLRIHNAKGKALYIFIADGPRLKTTCEMTKLVHIAVPKNETPNGLAQMFHTMKDFNPNWAEIRTFLVDPQFRGGDAVAKAFPSSEVVLSVFHICKSFQHKISRMPLPHQTHALLVKALKNTMCSATVGNLLKMHTILQEFVRPGWLEQLNPEWLLVNRIWALHRWRSWSECCFYFENMETLNRELGDVFSGGFSLESTIIKVANLIQEGTVNKPVPDVRNCSSYEEALLKGGEAASPTDSDMESENAKIIKESLDRICMPAAAELCLKELEVAQKSVQLMGTNEDQVNIQLLENLQEVRLEIPSSCTCHFNQCLHLPCRHILAVLDTKKEVLMPEMMYSSWLSRGPAPTATPVPQDILDILQSESKGASGKHQSVEVLSNQITHLLAECNTEEFHRRYNTLRELADAWIGPYEQVKL